MKKNLLIVVVSLIGIAAVALIAANVNPTTATVTWRKGTMHGEQMGLVLPCSLKSGDTLFTAWIHDDGNVNPTLIGMFANLTEWQGSFTAKVYMEISFNMSNTQLYDSITGGGGAGAISWDTMALTLYGIPASYVRLLVVPSDSCMVEDIGWHTIGNTRP